MARRALRYVLLSVTAAFVNKLARDPRDLIFRRVRSCQLMTTVACVGDRLLGFPVTVETRCVLRRDGFESRGARRVADGAVVVLRWRVREPQQRNHVLMPVMRELDRKLKPGRRVTKRESHLIARRCLRMANGADRRPRTAEELRPVTTHTRVVARIILDVRKSYFVAGVASGPVFLRGVRELGIISRG